MIKKIALFALGLGFLAPMIATAKHCCDCDNERTCRNWQLIFKQGYFLPHDKTLKCMFKNDCQHAGGYYLEGAARYRLCRGLFLDLSGSWFRHRGRSVVLAKSITIKNSSEASAETMQPAAATPTYGEPFCFKLPTFGFGLKYFYDLCCDCVNIFAGVGGKAYFLRVTSDYPGCCKCDKSNSVGGYVGGGLQYLPFCGFTLEGFVDYNFKTISTKKSPNCSMPTCLNVGGLVAGIGIGYTF
jgi:hypothetical protein